MSAASGLAATAPVLEVRSLHKDFHVPGSRDLIGVLRGVDLVAGTGTVVVVDAAPGTGATTMVRCLAGTYRPTGGHVVVGGGPPVDISVAGSRMLAWLRRTRIAVLDGPLAAPPRALVAEAVGRASGAGDASAREQLATGSLSGLGIGALLDVPVGALRPDRARVVALAAALLTPRPLLLLDDPLRGLDHDAVRAVVEAVDRRRRAGALVVATGQADTVHPVRAVADRAGNLHEGVIRWSSSTMSGSSPAPVSPPSSEPASPSTATASSPRSSPSRVPPAR